MGNECCSRQHQNREPEFTTIEEFYDPFSEIRKNINWDTQTIHQHSPNNARVMHKLPASIIKK